MRILILGLLLSSYAAASDQYQSDYMTQLQQQRQNAVAQSCRASLPVSSEKRYYNVEGVLLEAHDYCMFLAVQYVRQELYAPAPRMSTADNTTPIPAQ